MVDNKNKNNNNEKCKQKLGDAVIRTGAGLWYTVGVVFFTAVALVCAFGKAVFEQGEKLAESGQTYTACKAVENFSKAGADTKEAFNLYLESSDKKEDDLPNQEKDELPVDEGYSSGSEKEKA